MRDSRFAVTVDTDFCPQFMLDHFLEVAAGYGVELTLFCTGAYAVSYPQQLEIALHVNFMSDSTQGGEGLTEEERLSAVKRDWPQAKGMRTHRLYWHAGLYGMLRKHDLTWDSSLICPLQAHLAPQRAYGLTRLPLWWADGLHMSEGLSLAGFNPPGLSMPGLKILLMHPVHLYMNTSSPRDLKERLQGKRLELMSERELTPLRFAGAGMEKVYLDALRLVQHEGGGSVLGGLL